METEPAPDHSQVEALPPTEESSKLLQKVLASGALLAVIGTLFFLAAKGTGNGTDSVQVSTSTTAGFAGRITGTFSLGEEMLSYERVGGSCSGRGGYSDISSATQVTVSDASGTLKAVGHLGPGTWTQAAIMRRCEFSFTITDVPRLDLYQIEVGRRGKLAYTYEQLRAANFTVSTTLGD